MFASRSVLASAFALLAASLTTTVSAGQTPDGVFDGNGGSLKIDYQPPFTAPEGGEVWFAGMSYSASWKQELPENIPLENVSKTADLVMGYKTDGESSLHLTWTLAEDVPLYAPNSGSVDFTLPADLETRNSYFLVLLGSTHNQSPEFTVVANPVANLLNGSSSSSPSSSSSAPSSTTSSAAPAATTTPAAAAAAGAPAGDSLPFRRRSESGKFRLVARK